MNTKHTPGPWHVGLIPAEQITISSHGFKHKASPSAAAVVQSAVSITAMRGLSVASSPTQRQKPTPA